ncbi:MAG: efflux transporter outer membrane subunit [Simkaniaceae bacterium]|nr:efflux transporter outer membrane subunit [Simkaniaceae bacterium]
MKRGLFFLSSVMVLGGCTVGPRYTPPEPDPNARYGAVERRPSRGKMTSLAGFWDRFFGDPLLSSLLKEALVHNLDLRIADQTLKAACEQKRIKTAALFPEIDARLEARRIRVSQTLSKSEFLGPTMQSFYFAGPDLSWEIDLFGKKRQEREIVMREIEAQELETQALAITLVSRVASGYLRARALRARLLLEKERIRTAQTALSLGSALTEAGLASVRDRIDRKYALLRTRIDDKALQALLEEEMEDLAFLLGLSSETFGKRFTLPDTPFTFRAEEVDPKLPADLIRNRPDIRKAERLLAGHNARVGSAIADLFPRISLLSECGVSSSVSDRWLTSRSITWFGGPKITWPLLYFQRLRADIRMRKALEKRACLEYERTVLRAVREVETALILYYEAKERKVLAEELAGKRRQQYRMTQSLYEGGLAPLGELLTAHNEMTEAETIRIDYVRDAMTALITLHKALGGDFATNGS